MIQDHPQVSASRIVSIAREIAREHRLPWDDVAPIGDLVPSWDAAEGPDHTRVGYTDDPELTPT